VQLRRRHRRDDEHERRHNGRDGRGHDRDLRAEARGALIRAVERRTGSVLGVGRRIPGFAYPMHLGAQYGRPMNNLIHLSSPARTWALGTVVSLAAFACSAHDVEGSAGSESGSTGSGLSGGHGGHAARADTAGARAKGAPFSPAEAAEALPRSTSTWSSPPTMPTASAMATRTGSPTSRRARAR
jgi:hypothetical protein